MLPLRNSSARCGCTACWKCSTPPAFAFSHWCRLAPPGWSVRDWGARPPRAARRDARMIVVRGKGNKERLVPLNEASRQATADYLAAMEALKPEKKKNAAAPQL